MNVQVICDATMTLINVVTQWPGSTCYSFIQRHSNVGNRLETGAVWLPGMLNHLNYFKNSLTLSSGTCVLHIITTLNTAAHLQVTVDMLSSPYSILKPTKHRGEVQ